MWGVTARLTPFVELGNSYNAVNFNLKVSDRANTTVVSTTLSVLICPSEANPQPYMSTSRPGSVTVTGVTNYGWCEGDWYVYGGVGGMLNRSAFAVNASRTFAAITDGLSQTMVAAEVKATQPEFRSCFADGSGGTLPSLSNPNVVPDPASSIAVITFASPPCVLKIMAHSTWANGNSDDDGFTTALPPNTRVLVGSPAYDMDLHTINESDGGPTYAAVTSRSYHPGGVNTLFGDGSVRFIKNSINGITWRALGTIGGGEVVSSDSYCTASLSEIDRGASAVSSGEDAVKAIITGIETHNKWDESVLIVTTDHRAVSCPVDSFGRTCRESWPMIQPTRCLPRRWTHQAIAFDNTSCRIVTHSEYYDCPIRVTWQRLPGCRHGRFHHVGIH